MGARNISRPQPPTEDQGDRVGDAWDAARGDEAIQFSPVTPDPPTEPPEWLQAIGEFFGEILGAVAQAFGAAWPVMKWVLVALAVIAIAVVILRAVGGLSFRRKRTSPEQSAPVWQPDRGEALALLEDADRLAAEGRYDEATHLLLKRSVHQIATARPEWLDPSSTAREIARLPALPDSARAAFGAIATRVERSLFALRALGQEDWRIARAAYADFALENLEAAR